MFMDHDRRGDWNDRFRDLELVRMNKEENHGQEHVGFAAMIISALITALVIIAIWQNWQ
jgi:hypothetical protein